MKTSATIELLGADRVPGLYEIFAKTISVQ